MFLLASRAVSYLIMWCLQEASSRIRLEDPDEHQLQFQLQRLLGHFVGKRTMEEGRTGLSPCTHSCHRHSACHYAYVCPYPPRKALTHDARHSFFSEEVCTINTMIRRACASIDMRGMAYQQQATLRDSPTAAALLRERSSFPRESMQTLTQGRTMFQGKIATQGQWLAQSA